MNEKLSGYTVSELIEMLKSMPQTARVAVCIGPFDGHNFHRLMGWPADLGYAYTKEGTRAFDSFFATATSEGSPWEQIVLIPA